MWSHEATQNLCSEYAGGDSKPAEKQAESQQEEIKRRSSRPGAWGHRCYKAEFESRPLNFGFISIRSFQVVITLESADRPRHPQQEAARMKQRIASSVRERARGLGH